SFRRDPDVGTLRGRVRGARPGWRATPQGCRSRPKESVKARLRGAHTLLNTHYSEDTMGVLRQALAIMTFEASSIHHLEGGTAKRTGHGSRQSNRGTSRGHRGLGKSSRPGDSAPDQISILLFD